ncbi:MAG: hypothetical protein R3A52_00815 [Polyangiales bacterium]
MTPGEHTAAAQRPPEQVCPLGQGVFTQAPALEQARAVVAFTHSIAPGVQVVVVTHALDAQRCPLAQSPSLTHCTHAARARSHTRPKGAQSSDDRHRVAGRLQT